MDRDMAVTATISQLATALGKTTQAINKRKREKAWHSVNATGVDRFDIERIGLSADEAKAVKAWLQRENAAKAVAKVAAEVTPEAVAELPAERPSTPLATVADKRLTAVTALKDWQRSSMDARLCFVRLIERAEATGIGVTKAIRTLCEQARTGILPEEVLRLVPIANQRSGKDTKKRALAERTLFNWWSAWIKAGKNPASLAPKDGSIDPATGLDKIPSWAPAFLACYQKPTKPTVSGALDELKKILPKGECPSYAQASRFLKKVGSVEQEKGRRTGQELRSIKPYIIRDTSDMQPCEVYISDGLNFKSWGVKHPGHSRPFSPEICDVKDVATRKIVGWSAGLAESGQVMAAALRNAIETNGICLVYYHDNGPGYENRLLQDETTGIINRLGITNMTSIALQSQARGQIEKLRQDLWHKKAKEFLTYKGRDMDRQTKMRVYRLIKKDMKEQGTSSVLMPWEDFLCWCQEVIDEYNDRPHRSLPKIRDPETGRIRHMSPNEAWQKAINDGWQPEMLEKSELDDLFLPEKICHCRRGMVRLFGSTYAAPELQEYHGSNVRVGYDIHDPRAVRIRDAHGRLICFARFEANKRRYIATAVAEMAADKRAKAREARLQEKIDEVRLERMGTIEVNAAPLVIELDPETEALHQKLLAKSRGEVEIEDTPFLPADDFEAWVKLCEEDKEGLPLTDKERQWMADYDTFRRTCKKTGLVGKWDPFGERYSQWLERQAKAM